MSYRTVFAWVTAGVAFWCTMGELTIVQGASGVVRVAMLPGWLQLAASVVLALAVGAALSLQRARRKPAPGDPFLPLFTLAVLGLPYLPWLSDAVPALRLFAGPGRYFVWVIVVSQMVWAFLGMGRFQRVVGVRAWTPLRGVLIVSAASVVLFGAAVLASIPSGIHPSGDEPHYLALADSLWVDADRHIENNLAERGRARYIESEALADQVKVGRDGRTASLYPVGLPVLIAPVEAAFGYLGVVCLLLVVSALASGLAWLWVRRLTGSVSTATFAWAATALSLPFAFNATAVLPGIPAALFVVAVLVLGPGGSMPLSDDTTRTEPGSRTPRWRSALVGALAGALLWLSPLYSLMSAALVLVSVWRAWRQTERSGRDRLGLIAWMAGPCIALWAGWLAFNVWIWGSLLPPIVGGPLSTTMSVRMWPSSLPGLIFDQEYGIVAYAPVLLLSLTGLIAMLRAGGRARLLATELLIVCGALFAAVGAQKAWWGDQPVPGRQVTLAVLLLAPPIAWRFRAAATAPSKRAVHRMLLLVGVSVSLAALVTQNGALIASRHDGISRLIEYFSPDWNLWAYVPDFVAQSLPAALSQTAIWGIAALLCCGMLNVLGQRGDPDPARSRTGRGAAFLRASASVLLTFLVVTLVTPPVMGARLRVDLAPEDRPRDGLLDTYDPHARPIAVRFDSLTWLDARQVPQLVAFSAAPGTRTARQPMRLVLNARFILPAGRYVVRLESAGTSESSRSLSGTLDLQFGRIGPPLFEWSVSGSSWEQTFDLPVDGAFVGFRASPELEKSVGLIRVHPVSVTPILDRIASSEVLAAASYGPVIALFHDDVSYPELGGFWLRGKASSRVSIVSPTGRLAGDVTLRMRAGPIDNTVVIDGAGGEQRVALAANQVTEVRLSPAPLDGTLRLTLTPERGWVPAERDPASRDRRLLGCWVDVPR